ncbi:hypothetical protein UVI_02000150 [Ustilaginoidea virens]|uniref:Secreted protein n=1 Tax=Ustilaginoidea virens TaxID=1159556 RepID=A0A1B5KYR5_USTVR|nr:hypothetical protein UVI_02000150 [Ustilaginoidea virens]
MIPPLLVILSLSACAQAVQVSSEQAVAYFISQLNQTISIDMANPPWMDGDIQDVPLSCIDQECPVAQLWKRTLLQSLDYVDILYTAHSETPRLNAGTEDMLISFTKSTAVMVATTWGWHIGAKFTYSGQAIQVGYSVSTTVATTVTTSETDSINCQAGYECTVKTLTFYTMVHGKCVTPTYLKCWGVYNICDYATQPCPAFQNLHDSTCRADQPVSPCSIRVPLLDDENQPIIAKVAVSNKIPGGTKRSLGRRLPRSRLGKR